MPGKGGGGVDLAVSKEIPKLEDKINNLENRIDGLHLPRTTKTHSPLNLNDFGEKVSKKLKLRSGLKNRHMNMARV